MSQFSDMSPVDWFIAHTKEEAYFVKQSLAPFNAQVEEISKYSMEMIIESLCAKSMRVAVDIWVLAYFGWLIDLSLRHNFLLCSAIFHINSPPCSLLLSQLDAVTNF